MKFNQNKFHIGTYVLQPYARSEQHIKELSECGIDLVFYVNNDPRMLDLFYKYGVSAVINGLLPKWWGGDGTNAGSMAIQNPIDKYENAINNFIDHPAIVGIDVGDEPSAIDFKYYNEVIKTVSNAFKDKFIYLNIYPNYGYIATNTNDEIIKQLGTNTYEEYINDYFNSIDLNYLSYDHYLYSSSVSLAYENLRIVSKACLKFNKPTMIVLQVNSHDPKLWISENQLRFQAYSALCFGASSITWGCYTAGWFNNQVLDDKGNKTEQYEKLKNVNKELLTFVDTYMNYQYVSTHFLSFNQDDKDLVDVNIKPQNELSISNITNFHVSKGKKVLLGYFVNNENIGLMLCAADDPYDVSNNATQIRFKAEGYNVILHQDSNSIQLKTNNDFYCIDLISCHGAFIELKILN